MNFSRFNGTANYTNISLEGTQIDKNMEVLRAAQEARSLAASLEQSANQLGFVITPLFISFFLNMIFSSLIRRDREIPLTDYKVPISNERLLTLENITYQASFTLAAFLFALKTFGLGNVEVTAR